MRLPAILLLSIGRNNHATRIKIPQGVPRQHRQQAGADGIFKIFEPRQGWSQGVMAFMFGEALAAWHVLVFDTGPHRHRLGTPLTGLGWWVGLFHRPGGRVDLGRP